MMNGNSEVSKLRGRIGSWVVRCFGSSNLFNPVERSMRIVEEAIELAQAHGIPSEIIERILVRVYSRPVGTVEEEIGGVWLTVLAHAAGTGVDGMESAQRLLTLKLENTDPEVFRRKHQAKVALGIGAPIVLPEP